MIVLNKIINLIGGWTYKSKHALDKDSDIITSSSNKSSSIKSSSTKSSSNKSSSNKYSNNSRTRYRKKGKSTKYKKGYKFNKTRSKR
jgi:hypothetical protein